MARVVRRARWDLLPKDRPWPSLIGLELGSGGEKNTPRKGVLEPGMFMGGGGKAVLGLACHKEDSTGFSVSFWSIPCIVPLGVRLLCSPTVLKVPSREVLFGTEVLERLLDAGLLRALLLDWHLSIPTQCPGAHKP